jgi:hypothetical protein
MNQHPRIPTQSLDQEPLPTPTHALDSQPLPPLRPLTPAPMYPPDAGPRYQYLQHPDSIRETLTTIHGLGIVGYGGLATFVMAFNDTADMAANLLGLALGAGAIVFLLLIMALSLMKPWARTIMLVVHSSVILLVLGVLMLSRNAVVALFLGPGLLGSLGVIIYLVLPSTRAALR